MFRQVLRANFQFGGRTGWRCFSSAAEEGSRDHIQSLVAGKKVVVFMKGTPDSPRCGFSNAVIQVLKLHGVDKYDSHDVLSNEKIRQGVKEFSSWPTIPQVFINGEFVGGCDIMIEMHQNGELIEELKKINVRSSLDQQ